MRKAILLIIMITLSKFISNKQIINEEIEKIKDGNLIKFGY